MKEYIIKTTGFTLIELLIVVAIIAILAGTVIVILNPGERMLDAREAARESHMITIGEAIHLAVLDCTTSTADYCSSVQDVVDICQTTEDDDWQMDPDKANCPLDDNLDPADPLSGDPYYIEHDGANNVKIWAADDESEWYCGGGATCSGGTYKRF